ncbi:MAG: hypothetical protein FGM24_08480 [Candidatus Kapabacteria bacterium]|nr:hypothetical protein [Candidatus Kapabacteria bacterium]
MKFTHKLIATVATGVFLAGSASAQNPTRLQLLDAQGDRGVLTLAPITGGEVRTYTLSDVSGTVVLTPVAPTSGKLTRWGANATLADDATGILEGDIANEAVTSAKVKNGSLKLEDLDPASIGTVPPGTTTSNTLRWNGAGSGSWVETSKMRISADGDLIVDPTRTVGIDKLGGYLRIREATAGPTDFDVILRADGTGDAYAELILGGENDQGDFVITSMPPSGFVQQIRTDSDVLKMGTSSTYLWIDGDDETATVRGDVTVSIETALLNISYLTTNGVLKATSGNISSGLLATADIGDEAVTTAKVKNGTLKLEDFDATSVGALAPGTVEGNTLRWNNTGKTWDQTALLTVTANNEVIADATVVTGGDTKGGYARFRKEAIDPDDWALQLQAFGASDALAYLQLGGENETGDFWLYSKTSGGVIQEIRTDNDLLTMGTTDSYIRFDGTPASEFTTITGQTGIELSAPLTQIGALHTSSSIRHRVEVTAANPYVVDAGDDDHIIIATTAGAQVNLPAAPANGRFLIIKCETGGAGVAVNPNGNNINGGGANFNLDDNESISIVFSAGNWHVVSQSLVAP